MIKREKLQLQKSRLLVEQCVLMQETRQIRRFSDAAEYAIKFLDREIRLLDLVTFCQTGSYPE
jgi:hypothetical protein